MHAKGKKSKKQSAASSASQWPPDAVLFLDKCLGNYDVALALRKAGMKVELHATHFEQDAKDQEWLLDVGKRGWIVLTKDRHLQSNYLQLVAILRGNVKAFALSAADVTGAAMAAAFVAALPTMRSFVRRFDPPFIARVSALGHVRMLLKYAEIHQRVLDRRE
jgi:hypothetical protein